MPPSLRQPHRLTLLVFAAGMALTGAAALFVRHRLDDDAHALFERNVARLAQEIDQRLGQPVQALQAAAAFGGLPPALASSRGVPAGPVDVPAARGDVPGLLGIGFVWRERGGGADGASRAPDRYLTRGIGPHGATPAGPTIDLGQDPRTRHAIELAVATGRPVISPRLDTAAEGGAARLHLYVPVYPSVDPANHRPAPPATAAQRDAALRGLLYAPIDPQALLQGLFEVEAGRLRFELLDRVEPVAGDRRLAVSEAAGPASDRSGAPAAAAIGGGVDGRADGGVEGTVGGGFDGGLGRHTATRTLTLLGRSLTLRVASTGSFDGEERLAWPWWVVGLGTLSSALMAGLLWQQAASRQRAEALARGMTAELAQLALVAQETSNAVVITDVSRRITWVNAGFERVTGYSAAEALGRSPGALLQFEGTDRQVVARMRAALDAGRPFSGDILNRDKHGRAYWLRLHIQPLRDAAGGLTGFMAVETDITELVDATESAQRANRAKSEFIAMISHDLRTPLQSIVGFSELGEHFAHGQAQLAQMFGDILAGGRRMLALVNSLLEVARTEGTTEAPVLRPGDLGELAAEVAHELWPQAAGRHLRIAFAADLGPMPVQVDAFRIQQVLRNVLANAIRFAPEGSVIEVGGTVDRGEVVMDVRDRGPGIPEDELEAIFEPFVQSSRTRGGVGGSGLGLTICRKILRAHHGRIVAANLPGGGARLRITLPADRSTPTSTAIPTAPPAVPATRRAAPTAPDHAPLETTA